MYKRYSLPKIFLRRTLVILAGTLALPFMLFRRDRARFYSYLHRVWCKISAEPVWLAQANQARGIFW